MGWRWSGDDAAAVVGLPAAARGGDSMVKRLLVGALIVAACWCGQAQARLSPERLRELVYRTHPCLAQIIDWEHSEWDPTTDYGHGHGNVDEPYGLPMANPGRKMKSAGSDWRTNPWTQIRWALDYGDKRYGGECAARDFWRAHGWW